MNSKSYKEQIEKHHNQITALHSISKVVSNLSDIDTILNIALDNVLYIINGTIGGILLMDKDPGVLYYRAYQRFIFGKTR